jgi:hypothetical protein
MNDDVVARINSIPPETYLRISYYKPDGRLSDMHQGWLKTVDFKAGTLTLKDSGTEQTVFINNINSARDIDDQHTGSGSSRPAVSGGTHFEYGVGWVPN